MTLQNKDIDEKTDDLEQKIADYLIAHPNFFERHPKALSFIDIPHPTGNAVSLIERQVRALRQHNQELKEKLDDLIDVARENESLTDRLHHLTLSLIEARNFDEALNTLQDELRNLFKADAVEIKLFSREELDAHPSDISPALFKEFIDNQVPNCGELSKKQLEYLFGYQAKDTYSVALIPVQSPPLIGILAIGSGDKDRFNSDKSVDFLKRLADIVSATLTAVSSPGV
tara:strand:+ start:3359 stop:4045 length:687 start_codon:yes stop_codon:yes gene_type:complete